MKNVKSVKLIALAIATLCLSACFDDDDDNEAVTNSPPQALSANLITQTETDIVSNLPASDPDRDPLTFSLLDGPSFGSLILGNNGAYTYSPFSEFTGTDSFTYSVSDGQSSNATVSGTITITVEALAVSFLSQSRLAFGQAPNDEPLSVNGRDFTQDVSGESDYQDLIDAN
jgi:hypothetical protein